LFDLQCALVENFEISADVSTHRHIFSRAPVQRPIGRRRAAKPGLVKVVNA